MRSRRCSPGGGRASSPCVRIFSQSTVSRFGRLHAQAREPLRAWFKEVTRARWSGPADVKQAYASASFLGGDRIVFNIKGNA